MHNMKAVYNSDAKKQTGIININNDKEYMDKGLSEKEAAKRLKKHGYNILGVKKKKSPAAIFLSQFANFMIIILLGATAVSAAMGDMIEAVTIVAIVIINAILGFIQEFRTEKTMEVLKEMAAPSARVIRDGRVQIIAAQEVVPGDIIMLEAGDRVPADAIVIESKNLHVEESMLTGESVPVEKSSVSHEERGIKLDTSYNKNGIYMGTIVTMGRAKAIVAATGMNTEMGKIADMIQSVEDEATPLQQRLEHLGRYIVYSCLIICGVVTATGMLRGEDTLQMLLSGISLAVAAIPEGLPAIVTIALALGVQRMLKRNALVRKLPAVETLGCADVICSDKTGTITENKMTVRKVYAGEDIFDITGTGYKVSGDIICKGRNVKVSENEALNLALTIGVLCNNASIHETQKNKGKLTEWLLPRKEDYIDIEASGDPTEVALMVAAYKAGIRKETLIEKYQRLDELPFDSERKCMSVIYRNKKNERFVFTKGAPDIIIKKCSKIQTSKGIIEMNNIIKTTIMKINEDMASQALRVLGTAYRKMQPGETSQNEVEKDLIFVGLVGMIDPPRKEAAEAVRKCKMAGIKPVMITGDHKATAAAIARETGILADGQRVLTGQEIDTMSEKQLEKLVEDTSVYARVSPKHKLSIVKALKNRGHIVAMTGDGVNDAPAVKEADIGISMGISGTDVTKEASSMILLDDNFSTIVAAVEEGRVIYNNIRKFIRYLLACNIGEVLTMFLAALSGLPVPLLPIQILWVNLVTDGLPAIALSLEPPDKDVMLQKPRNKNSHIFSDGLASLIIFRGVLLSICTLSVFWSVLHFTSDITLARSSAFVTLVLTQLTHVFECKSEKRTLFEINIFNNIYLVMAVLCSLCMILSVIYLPFLRPVFKTAALTWDEWTLVAGFCAIGPVVSSIFRKKKR